MVIFFFQKNTPPPNNGTILFWINQGQTELGFIGLKKSTFGYGGRWLSQTNKLVGFHYLILNFEQDTSRKRDLLTFYDWHNYAITSGDLQSIAFEYFSSYGELTFHFNRPDTTLNLHWPYQEERSDPFRVNYSEALQLNFNISLQFSRNITQSTWGIGGVFLNYFKWNEKKLDKWEIQHEGGVFNKGLYFGAQGIVARYITIECKNTWDNHNGHRLSLGIHVQAMDSTDPLYRPIKQPLLPLPYKR
jgi:hypothetical protein